MCTAEEALLTDELYDKAGSRCRLGAPVHATFEVCPRWAPD